MWKPNVPALLASFSLTCLVVSPLYAASSSSSGVIAAIEKKYQVTEMTADHEQVTKDGTTMALKCAGIYSVPSTMTLTTPDNKIVDGRVQPPNMFAKQVLVKMGAHVLQTGDKVYITKIDSKNDLTGDSLKFTILTVSSLDVTGGDAQKKYNANVTFKFKKGYLDDTPPEEVEQAVEAVMAPDEGTDDSKGQDKASSGGQAQTQAAAHPAPAAPAPVPPPAPAPPAAAPATITIGESSTEVLQAMGMPLQMIDLGKKKTFVYKTMKIIFMNDKVSDVQ